MFRIVSGEGGGRSWAWLESRVIVFRIRIVSGEGGVWGWGGDGDRKRL